MIEQLDWTNVSQFFSSNLLLQGDASSWPLGSALEAAAASPLLAEALRFAHVLAVIAGLGAAFLLETVMLSRCRAPLSEETISLIKLAHRLIAVAVAALWLTGAALLALMLQSGTPPAKVLVKVAIVLLLTLNMRVIGVWAMPRLARSVGNPVTMMRAGPRATLGAVAGFSAGCWMSALMLGTIDQFRPMTLPELAPIFGAMLLVATMCGAVIGLSLALMRPKSPAAEPEIQTAKTPEAPALETQTAPSA